MSVTHRVIYGSVSVTTRLSRGTGVSVTQRDTHRLSAIDVGHTPRDLSRCVGHNRVISWYGCVRHTARYRGPSHTACPPSMSVTHRVIYRGVSVTTGLSRGPSHTARCRGVSVTQHCVISWYVSHTVCPPSMSVTHRVIYRSVLVTTGLSRGTGVSITQRDIAVHRTPPVRHRCRSHTA